MPGPLNPSDPIFKYLHILKIEDIYKQQVLKFIYKWQNLSIPSNFNIFFVVNRNIHVHNSRSNTLLIMEKLNFNDMSILPRDTLHCQYSRLVNYGGKALKVIGPIMWNDLPDKIRALSSLCLFKRRVKSRLLDQYCTAEIVKNHYYVSKY